MSQEINDATPEVAEAAEEVKKVAPEAVLTNGTNSNQKRVDIEASTVTVPSTDSEESTDD